MAVVSLKLRINEVYVFYVNTVMQIGINYVQPCAFLLNVRNLHRIINCT